MKSDKPADRARAVYLMLLVTHPSIQGDPTDDGEYNELLSKNPDESTWYTFKITIDGTEYTLYIGIYKDYAYVQYLEM